jgi:hypothetical protein
MAGVRLEAAPHGGVVRSFIQAIEELRQGWSIRRHRRRRMLTDVFRGDQRRFQVPVIEDALSVVFEPWPTDCAQDTST